MHKKHNRTLIDFFTTKFNRSNNQVGMLLEILNYDYKFYNRLEIQMFNCGIFQCPSSLEEITDIMALIPKVDGSSNKDSYWRIIFNSPIFKTLKEPKDTTEPSVFKQACDLTSQSGYSFFCWCNHEIYHKDGNSTGLFVNELN